MLFAIYRAAAVVCRRADAQAIVRSSLPRQQERALKCLVRNKVDRTDVAMVRILNVAEKNDAAKSLADIMSAGRYTKVHALYFLQWNCWIWCRSARTLLHKIADKTNSGNSADKLRMPRSAYSAAE